MSYKKVQGIGSILSNHKDKIMCVGVVLLHRIVEECRVFQWITNWIQGAARMYAETTLLLLLRVFYDQVINNNNSYFVTFIDYSVPQIHGLGIKKEQSNLPRNLFCDNRQALQGWKEQTERQCIYSGKFNVGRGVVQVDVISSVLFIFTFDQIIQEAIPWKRQGRDGRILKLRVLTLCRRRGACGRRGQRHFGEADCERLRTSGGEKLTSRSAHIPKTKSKYVHRREPITVTEEEVRTMEEGYEHKCDFYPRRLKTWRGMSIHWSNGVHNSDTTEGAFPLEDITEVFGYKDTRWFQVKCGKGWEAGVGARQKTC